MGSVLVVVSQEEECKHLHIFAAIVGNIGVYRLEQLIHTSICQKELVSLGGQGKKRSVWHLPFAEIKSIMDATAAIPAVSKRKFCSVQAASHRKFISSQQFHIL